LWDYEWAEEPTPRVYTLSNYQEVAGLHLIDEALANPFHVQDTVYLALHSHLFAPADETQDEGPLGSDFFGSTNTLLAQGEAEGYVSTKYVEIEAKVEVKFDLIPQIHCLVNCPSSDATTEDDLQGLVCPLLPQIGGECGGSFDPCSKAPCGLGPIKQPPGQETSNPDAEGLPKAEKPAASSATVFFTTDNPMETQALIQALHAHHGEHQKILVLVSPSSFDWDAYARENNLHRIHGPTTSNQLPGAPLLTIVERGLLPSEASLAPLLPNLP
jgi:hypothetical protein